MDAAGNLRGGPEEEQEPEEPVVIPEPTDEQIEECLSDTEFEAPEAEAPAEDMDRCVVISGLPVVGASKYSKLVDVVTKRSLKDFSVDPELTFWMPQDEAGNTSGIGIAQLETPQEAARLCREWKRGFQFAKHTLVAVPYVKLAEAAETPADYTAPDAPLPERTQRADLLNWLNSPNGDQLLVRSSEDGEELTQVTSVNTRGVHRAFYRGDKTDSRGNPTAWATARVQWSPQGSYVATYHQRGCPIWGGDDFHPVVRLEHFRMQSMIFSPCERFAATWSPSQPREAMKVWDIRTGECMRSFPVLDPPTRTPVWGFTPDGEYFCRLNDVDGDRKAAVYKLPTMEMLDKQSLASSRVQAISVCPAKRNYMLWWAPDSADKESKLTLVALPSKRALRSRKLFNLINVDVHWHPAGRYLAVTSRLLTKAQARRRNKELREHPDERPGEVGGNYKTSVDLYRLDNPSVPMESITIDGRFEHFAWEPNGHRFSVVHGAGATRSISFYTMRPSIDDPSQRQKAVPRGAGERVQELYTLPSKSCNLVCWSPTMPIAALAGLGDMGGAVELFDMEAQETIQKGEHPLFNGISFDPSGRLLVTSKRQPFPRPGLDISLIYTADNGYVVWNGVTGVRLEQRRVEKLFQVEWRPRPRLEVADEAEASGSRRGKGKQVGNAPNPNGPEKATIKRYQEEDRLMAKRERLHNLIRRNHQLTQLRQRTESGLQELNGFLAARRLELFQERYGADAALALRPYQPIRDVEREVVVVKQETTKLTPEQVAALTG